MTVPVSSKGKGKELEIGWWQLLPLAERDTRPVVWSGMSTIFTAHHTRPCVVCRHFPSLNSFELPAPESPPSIKQTFGSYEPPTIISLSPDNSWLFAYFPGHSADGIGCIWSKGAESDDWSLKKFWISVHGEGVVAAAWTSTHRQWAVSLSGATRRLPPRGPRLPTSTPILILVTQSQTMEIWYLRVRTAKSEFQVLQSSLAVPTMTAENHPKSIPKSKDPSWVGIKRCVSAAIGIGYNDSTILVAMRNYLYPCTTSNSDSMHLPFHLNVPPSDANSPEVGPANDWEIWGEDPSIELCEVQVHFDNLLMSVSTKPMPPIVNQESCISRLIFISRDSQAINPVDGSSQSRMQLVASSINFGDYSLLPQTKLYLYSFSKNVLANKMPWSVRLAASRAFTETPLVFVVPASGGSNLLVGILNTDGNFTGKKSQTKEVAVGKIVSLKVEDLSDDRAWEPSIMLASVGTTGIDLPLNSTLSPNETLLCCASLPTSASSMISVQSTPRRLLTGGALSPVSCVIVTAILNRHSPTDVVHVMCGPLSSLEQVSEDLLGVLVTLEKGQSNTRAAWIRDVLGVAMEAYRTMARHAEEELLEDLTGRWRAAHDFCTIFAYNSAFEDCRDSDSDGYDIEAIWQLVGLSSWIIEFLESLMKACMLLVAQQGENRDIMTSDVPNGLDLATHTSSIPHILLHLVHPDGLAAFRSLFTHLRQFRSYLGNLPTAVEDVQIAKDVLLDLVDCSGIDLFKLDPLLVQFSQEIKTLSPEVVQKSLACCRPLPRLRQILGTFATKINSSNVVDKPRLFIKPSDLIDGVSRMSLSSNDHLSGLGKDRNVVSKSLLGRHGKGLVCLRCAGRSEKEGAGNIGGHISLRWTVWEKNWSSRCICGGQWRLENTLTLDDLT